MGYLSSPLEPLEIAKNSVFWAKSRGSRGGDKEHPTTLKKISAILSKCQFNKLKILDKISKEHSQKTVSSR